MRENTQYSLLYILKGVRIIFMVTALMLASTMFINMYNQQVVFDKQPAPPLAQMVLWYIAIEFAMNAVLWLVLFLWTHAQKPALGVFDGVFFMRLITDYIVTTTLIVSIGCMVGVVLQKKLAIKTFGSQGSEEISAFRQMLMVVSGVVLLVPTVGWV